MSHKIQIDNLIRETTVEESDELETHYLEAEKHDLASEKNKADRANAITKLAELGLTSDEIAALVGA